MNLDEIARFIWFWNDKFFVEAESGNYIWSDPSYPNGNNTIRPYKGTCKDYCESSGVEFGRDKGSHRIAEYCGPYVRFVEDQ